MNISDDKELSQLLSNSSLDPESRDASSTTHPRFNEYKKKGVASCDQGVRRLRALEMQKKARQQLHERARKFVEQDEVEQVAMDTSSVTSVESNRGKGHQRQGRHQYTPIYRDQLMQSEWLLEVPSDLSESYVMLLVPEGKRNLLVARRGHTVLYSRQGYAVSRFESILPGGSGQTQSNSTTVLDCIVSNTSKVIYVLDLMMWAGRDFYGCSTEFRHFMRDSKLSENPQLLESSNNKLGFKFQALPHFACDSTTLSNVFEASDGSLCFEDKLDGLLFYHKEAHYEPGVTPLVMWLKVFMVPEMLNVPVSEVLLSQQRPIGYSNMADFVAASQKRAEEAKLMRMQKSNEKKTSQDVMEDANNNNYKDGVIEKSKINDLSNQAIGGGGALGMEEV